jgi:hypothetical protein
MSIDRDPQIIRIVDFIDRHDIIRDREFTDSLVQGPAVVLSTGAGVLFDSCNFTGRSGTEDFEATLDALLIVLPEGPVTGLIGLDGVTFRNCSLENIGIAGTKSVIAEMRASLTA